MSCIWVSFVTILISICPLACLLLKKFMVMMHPLLLTTFFCDSRAPNAKDWIEESQEILKVLRDNLQVAQNQQKQCAYQHRKERQFKVNELVYLRLHRYKQTTIKGKGLEKLKPRFYGPYKVIRKMERWTMNCSFQ